MPYLIIGFLILLGLSGGVTTSTSEQVRPSDRPGVAVGVSTGTDRPRSETVSETTPTPDPVPAAAPMVLTRSAQNIETGRATLRGAVELFGETEGTAFFVYGYNENQVTAFTSRYDSVSDVPDENTTDAMRVVIVDQRADESRLYDRSVSSLVDDTEYFFRFCFETSVGIDELMRCGAVRSLMTIEDDYRSDRFSLPSVSVDRATNITAHEATLSGRYDVRDAVDGIAFFVYGESSELVGEVADEYDTYSAVREADEDLQKVRVGARLLGRGERERHIDDLERDTEYFYRFCLEYDGERSGLRCTSVRSFTTDSRQRDDLPDAVTGIAVPSQMNILLTGRVEMNDYHDGHAFVVYGLSEERVTAAAEARGFDRVGQAGDDLQRVSVDTDVDGNREVRVSISDPVPNAVYYYRTCVEYEAEDEYSREELVVGCGAVLRVSS